MTISKTDRDGLMILHIGIERLDGPAADTLRRESTSFITDYTGRIVLDMSGVRFVDSSGLGALVAMHKALPAGQQLEIAGADKSVMSLFKLTRMDRVFQMHSNIESVA